jgi:hypothetical protein
LGAKPGAFALQGTAPDMQSSELPCNPVAKPAAKRKNFSYI